MILDLNDVALLDATRQALTDLPAEVTRVDLALVTAATAVFTWDDASHAWVLEIRATEEIGE